MSIIENIKTRGKEMSVLQGKERLHYLIDLARKKDPLADKHKIEENRIRGCASNLWVIGNKNIYINKLTSIENAKNGDLSVVHKDGYLKYISKTYSIKLLSYEKKNHLRSRYRVRWSCYDISASRC